MTKFFLFKSSKISPVSSVSSDNGDSISVIALPSTALSSVTAGYGSVDMVFNDASVYQDVNLSDGEAFEKTRISVSCVLGQEVDLIESILKSASRDSGVVIFDSGEGKSSFNEFEDSDKVISCFAKENPVFMSGGISYQRDANYLPTNDFVIAGVDFRNKESVPVLDFNENQLSGYSNNNSITSWSNDIKASGGSRFNITSVTGSGAATTSAAAHTLSGTNKDDGTTSVYAKYGTNGFHTMASELVVEGEYTLYVVLGRVIAGYSSLKVFGNASGTTVGITIDKNSTNTLSIRHGNLSGGLATVKTNNNDFNTASYEFPRESIVISGSLDGQDAYPFVIRRDSTFNIYFYNHLGELISYIPAKSRDSNDPLKTNSATSGRTDGSLQIKQIGSSGSDTATSFTGTLARFGVIGRDVGHEHASEIAKQLFFRYNPNINL